MVNRFGSLILIIISLLQLNACAQLLQDYDEPSIQLNSVDLLQGDDSPVGLKLGLRVSNPNAIPLNVNGVAYKVSLDGLKVLEGVANQVPEIPAYGSAEFSVIATVDLIQGVRLISRLMTQPKEKIKYTIETKLDVGGGFWPALRIFDSGEINIGKL